MEKKKQIKKYLDDEEGRVKYILLLARMGESRIGNAVPYKSIDQLLK